MAEYVQVRAAVLQYIHDQTTTNVPDVIPNYGAEGAYNDATSLGRFGLPPEVLSTMSRSFNRAMGPACGGKWKNAGSIDLGRVATIGALIDLGCRKSGTTKPAGAPA